MKFQTVRPQQQAHNTMAEKFTPKHTEEIPLNGIKQEEFIALLFETAKKLTWKIAEIHDSGLIAFTNNGRFSWNGEIRITIENNIAKIQSASIGKQRVDWGDNKKNVEKFTTTLLELNEVISKEELEVIYRGLSDGTALQDNDSLEAPQTIKEGLKEFLSLFIPIPGYFITPILVNINILIFIIMIITGVDIFLTDNESLLKWGASFRPLTLEGEWWRLITSCFLHIGIMHLLLNMYALLNIGVLLEPILGRTRFIAAYLLAGIGSSVQSLWWHEMTISAGASGAIFGMYGVFLALLTTNFIEKTARRALLTSVSIFMGYNLIFAIRGNIDNAGHIGGLITGLIIGYSLLPSIKKPDDNKLKFGTIGLLTIITLSSSFVVYNKIPNDISVYTIKLKEFSSMESKALAVYNLLQTVPKDSALYELKNTALYYWEKNLKLVESFEKMELSDQLKERNIIIKEYCQLRIENCELFYKAISEDTDLYQRQLEESNKKIKAKLDELSGEKETE